MDAYPADYVFHNLPLIVLSGVDAAQPEPQSLPPLQDVLPGKGATHINSEIPALTSTRAQQLLQEFLDADGSDAPWNGRPGNRKGNLIGFKFRAAGRVGQAPALSLVLKCEAHNILGLYTAAAEG